MTQEQQLQLQEFLVHLSRACNFEMRDLKLENISFHVSPDMTYASLEHEVNETTGQLTRKSPACHTILAKL